MRKILLILLLGLITSTYSKSETISTREKIAQMLIVGFRGVAVDELTSEDMGAKYYIQKLGVGGVILYQRNIVDKQQVVELNNYLQSLSTIPLFISIDQEGGSVARSNKKNGFSPTVSAQYLGTQAIDTTKFYSERTAETLRNVGFNVNFAPCVDVNVNPNCPIIGAKRRSFSSDTAKVIKCAEAWVQGHRKYRVLSALKHFPGHGSSEADSHLGMTDVTNTWQNYELAPYRQLIKGESVDMVMISHVFNKKLDPDYPASLSKKIITGILREELNYDGVVISDDINMGAINDYYTFENTLELAINAGCDILIVSNNSNSIYYDPNLPLAAVDIIEKLVDSGRIRVERINEAYNRIMNLKKSIQ